MERDALINSLSEGKGYGALTSEQRNRVNATSITPSGTALDANNSVIGKTSVPVIVATPDLARKDVEKTKAGFADIQNGMVQQQQNNTAATAAKTNADALARQTANESTVAKEKNSALSSIASSLQAGDYRYKNPMTGQEITVSDPLINRDNLNGFEFLGGGNGVDPLTGKAKANASQNETDIYTQKLQSVSDEKMKAFQEYKARTEQMLNGTFPLTPDQQAMVGSLGSQFDRLYQLQEKANQNFEAGTTILQGASGRSRYAPEAAMGEIKTAVDAGFKKLGDIETQKIDAVGKLRVALQDNNYKLATKVYSDYVSALDEQSATLKEVHATVQKAADEAQAHVDDLIKQKQERLNYQQDLSASIAEAVADDIETLNPQFADAYYTAVANEAGIDESILRGTVSKTVAERKKAAASAEMQGRSIQEIGGRKVIVDERNGTITADLGPASSQTDVVKLDNGNTLLIDRATGKTIKNLGGAAPKAVGTGSGGLSTGSGKYASDLDALIGRVPNIIPSENGKVAFAESIKRARDDADRIAAIATAVLRNSPAPVRQDFANQATAVRNIDKAISLIDQGAKTGVLKNSAQYTYNLAGKDFDPKIASINSYITSAIQPYRNSVTGAAWGDQEEAEYQSLFGSTKYSPKELKDRLVRVKEILKDKSASALNSQVNPTSEYNPFIRGGASSGSTTLMTGPDGKQYNVPNDQVDTFIKDGGKR